MKIAGSVWALGAMSGTSLDGVDAALLKTDGQRIEGFGPTAYRAYTSDERDILRKALNMWPGQAGVDRAAEVVETAHASVMSRFVDARVAGFHGQTLAHDPRGRGTHQAGDGALMAEILGIPVVWDFRSSDIQLGGQGAPLAPFYHFALAQWLEAEAPVAFLNLGGVGNITWIDPRSDVPEAPGVLLAFDTGPANAPLNDLMRMRRGAEMDTGGQIASSGEVSQRVLDIFLRNSYFAQLPPKSLDRNSFETVSTLIRPLSDADAAATLTACAVKAVARAGEHFPQPVETIYLCGGGRKNIHMVSLLRREMDAELVDVDEVGLDGDMLEAQAFAFLAVRAMRGLPTTCPGTTGVSAAVGGGQISYPQKMSRQG